MRSILSVSSKVPRHPSSQSVAWSAIFVRVLLPHVAAFLLQLEGAYSSNMDPVVIDEAIKTLLLLCVGAAGVGKFGHEIFL